jgi:hypothetical protein
MLPDGRFVGLVSVSEPESSGPPATSQIRVVLNWTEELKQRVPTRRYQLAKANENPGHDVESRARSVWPESIRESGMIERGFRPFRELMSAGESALLQLLSLLKIRFLLEALTFPTSTGRVSDDAPN